MSRLHELPKYQVRVRFIYTNYRERNTTEVTCDEYTMRPDLRCRLEPVVRESQTTNAGPVAIR